MLVPFPLLQVWVSLGQGGGGFTETDLWEGVKTCVGAVVGL